MIEPEQSAPLTNAGNGHDHLGRFTVGNTLGRGNPANAKAQKIRAALLTSIKPNDIRAVVAKLVEMAKAGDLPAIKELLDRAVGRPAPSDVAARIEQLETLIMRME